MSAPRSERVEHVDVVAARGPVQRSLGVATDETRIHVGIRVDQHPDGRRAVRTMPRPVGEHVEQRARAGVVSDPRGRELGVVTQKRNERVDVAAVDRGGRRYRERVICGEDHRFSATPSYMKPTAFAPCT